MHIPIDEKKQKIAAVLFARGTNALNNNRLDEAIDCYLQCVKLAPDRLDIRQHLRAAEYMKFSHNGNGAADAAQRNTQARMALKIATARRKWAEVIESAEDILALNPWDASALLSICAACKEIGADELGFWVAQSACTSNGIRADALRAAAYFAERLGKSNAVIRFLEHLTERTMRVDGVNLTVADHGHGPPVLFVHGFPVNHSMWSEQQPACNGFRMIAPDLRGFGGSDATPGTTSMDRFAADLHGCLDALGVKEPVVYVGLSMGGYIAWPFLAQRPGRVRGLVLANTRVIADTPEGAKTRRETAERVLREGVGVVEGMLDKLFGSTTKAENPNVVEQGRVMIRQAKPLGVAGALLGMAERPDVSDRLAKLDVPTLIIAGAEDAVFPAREMEEFARAVPDAQFVRVERAGHMSPMENPAAFNDALGRFLNRVASV